MDTMTFDKLLLLTAFCCMASDGKIDDREVKLIKPLFEKSPLFENLNFKDEINQLVKQINEQGKGFIQNYFNQLQKTELTEQEELNLIDVAIQTINADEQVEYAEIKFFKNIRYRLKVDNDTILHRFPDIEMYISEDIVTESFLDKITNQYLNSTEIPQFEMIRFDTNFLDTKENA
ncbi:TerB family tellurite resistance protein [Candidatus Nomurabacteria bacterium]|nr:TerB family tellurite resistance protein [Candidatus Nomurabacteria bacterium]